MTRAPLPRPTLLPGLTRLWRNRHTLQLGLDPDRAVLLEVADPGAVRLLDLLDGTRSERAVLDQASTFRVTRDDARALIDTLRAAGLVVGAHTIFPTDLPEPVRRRLSPEAAAIALRGPDAPATAAQVLRRRRAARVALTGHGRLAAPVATALAEAGVGHVSPALSGTVTRADVVASGLLDGDVGRPRSLAVADAVRRVAPDTRTEPVARGRADIVVLVGADRPASLLATGYARRRQAHLALNLRDGVAVVGPLVPPTGTPCLRCLDLHRGDRDPDWPELAAQLAVGDRDEACAVPTLISAVGFATGEILAFLDGERPETVGAAVEISAPGRSRRRAWPPHPECGCSRRWRARDTGAPVERRPVVAGRATNHRQPGDQGLAPLNDPSGREAPGSGGDLPARRSASGPGHPFVRAATRPSR